MHIAHEHTRKGGDLAAVEGEGQGCAGSNERGDVEEGNDGRSSADDGSGPGSDDGAGAGSDNRNSACNASAVDLLAKPAPIVQEVVNHATNPTTGVGGSDPATDTVPTTDGSKSSLSPHASRCGSNTAGKQVGNSNGVSDVHGSPTAGSGTELQAQNPNVTGSQSCLPQEQPSSCVLASAVIRSARPRRSESSKPPHDTIPRTGSTTPDVAVTPVGLPMSLPMMPQVPAANAKLMRAPRMGDS
jgi:hypothetical protein